MSTRKRWPKIRTYAGFAVLVMVLSGLAGCASVEKVKPEPVVQAPAVPKGPSVVRFSDGRDGFIITEVPKMDESSREDFKRAGAMLNEHDYSKAIDLLEKIIARSPEVTAPYINLAIAYIQTDQPEQAEAHLKTALRLIPGHPVASNEYGLLCRKSGRFAEAREIYQQAAINFPEYYPVHRNLGILCDLYLNDPACALEHYEIYSEARPEDQQVKKWIADLHNRLGRN